MELKEYIKETIQQAYEGIAEAREANKDLNDSISRKADTYAFEMSIKIGHREKNGVLLADNNSDVSVLEFKIPMKLKS
ncbi:hypothetical protein JM79_2725 [Gramella sp. Hel_I_59]|uniref:hypothetical protein n=1 Tax=Gramella sp. Hel_I_59 TaxID=1249978 RepID=UPI001152F777|nr:hypothetical protein [Gramella sp. Hel_I_59]TQI71777.1 hypothetical protein JM79_2725 [Gramella sp. Hel_I_59]